jgi:hypothetical protein
MYSEKHTQMPITIDRKKLIDAARKKMAARVAAASQERRRAKYVTDASGNLVINAITQRRIPKSVAIDIQTPSGLLRTWDATGLFDWFITYGNTELRGLIAHLSPAVKLTRLRRQLKEKKSMSAKRHMVTSLRMNNRGRHIRERYEVAILQAMLLTIVVLALTGMYYSGSVVRGAVAGGGVPAAAMVLFGHSVDSRDAANFRAYRAKVDRLIDGIPFNAEERAQLDYLERRLGQRPTATSYSDLRAKVDLAEKKLTAMGF